MFAKKKILEYLDGRLENLSIFHLGILGFEELTTKTSYYSRYNRLSDVVLEIRNIYRLS